MAGTALAWLLLTELAVEAWYRYHERDLVARQGWTVQWPESAKAFRDLEIDERVSGILRFDEGRGASWQLQEKESGGDEEDAVAAFRPSSPLTCVAYFFRWTAGRSSILRARGHRPDICLPSVGWELTADHGSRLFSAGALPLPFRHFEFTRRGNGGQPSQIAHAFFCVGEDVVPVDRRPSEALSEINERQGLTLIPQLWRLVRSGARPHGQQVMQVILVGTRKTAADEAQAQATELIRSLVVAQPSPPPS